MLRRLLPLVVSAALLVVGCGSDGAGCGGGARASLSLWHEQAQFGAAFSLGNAAPGSEWRLVVVHEGEVESHADAHADAHGSLKVVRKLDEYAGVDHVTVRATGPDGRTCAASATLG
jgi:hypothetical protein